MSGLARVRLFGVVAACIAAAGCGGPAPPVAPQGASPDRDPAQLLAGGLTYARAGDMLRAEQYLAAALSAGAREEDVLPPLVTVAVAARHYRLALDYAEASLTRNPDRSSLRFLVGALYVAIGEAPRGRELLEGAASARPRDASVQFSVAVVLRDDLGDPAGADRYFRSYLELAPEGPRAREARASLMEKVQ